MFRVSSVKALATMMIMTAPRRYHSFSPMAAMVFQPRPATSIVWRRPQSSSYFTALFSTTPDLTYGVRRATFGIEDATTLKGIVANNEVVFVDVRNPDEIEEASLQSRPFVEGKFLLGDDEDAAAAASLLPNKDATHLVYCAKGGRAAKACQRLKDLGYSKVYNAGGFNDLGLFLDGSDDAKP